MALEGKLSYIERLELIQTLNSLSESQFKELFFALDPSPGEMPADAAALGDRGFRLLDWADKTGPGLATVCAILEQITRHLIERRDSPGKELSDILGLTIAAMTTSQLCVALDHAEAFLVKYPDYPGVRKLKADIQASIRRMAVKETRPKSLFVRHSAFEYEYEYESFTVDSRGKVRDRQKRQAECRTEELGNGVTLDMVELPGGQFQMGSPEGEGGDQERPQHLVSVDSFWMGKYPVTQAQWKAVVGFAKVVRDLDPDPFHFKGDNRPVERVSWDEAVEFCARLSRHTDRGYRLPSEAEWEYACRAGTITPYHFGGTISTGLANYYGAYQGTTQVGRFGANAFGLYDMHGNVWEWCLDHWHQNYDGAPTEGSAWIEGGKHDCRVHRGGSWRNFPDICRSVVREWNTRDLRYFYVGFRVVCASLWTFGFQ